MKRPAAPPSRLAAAFLAAVLLAAGASAMDGKGGLGGGQGGSRGKGAGSGKIGGGRGAGWGKGRGPWSPRVVIKMHRFRMPSPKPARIEKPFTGSEKPISYPQRDWAGGAVAGSPMKTPPPHGTIVGSASVMNDIEKTRAAETAPGKYTWHRAGGERYSHYVDKFGVHWYGFYRGAGFYWTRFHARHWWWYDPRYERWVYWQDGFWWWPGPSGQLFVYVGNAYYPYETEAGAVTVQTPELAQAASTSPASAYEGAVSTSADGSRMVQIMGPRDEAFLYDLSSSSGPVFMRFLASGAQRARFSKGRPGRPSRILLEFKDGAFALFDADGNSLDLEPAMAPGEELPAPPPEAPPDLSSAPAASLPAPAPAP